MGMSEVNGRTAPNRSFINADSIPSKNSALNNASLPSTSKINVKNSSIGGIHLPSTSKVEIIEPKILDLDVLSELPSDIRDQVVKEYLKQGYVMPRDYNAPSTSKNSITFSNSFDSKVDKLSDSDTMSTGGKSLLPVDENQDDEESDLNCSQMDQSFMSAMPDQIREELMRDYKRQKNVIDALTNDSPIVIPRENSAILSPKRPPLNAFSLLVSPKKLTNQNLNIGKKRGRKKLPRTYSEDTAKQFPHTCSEDKATSSNETTEDNSVQTEQVSLNFIYPYLEK